APGIDVYEKGVRPIAHPFRARIGRREPDVIVIDVIGVRDEEERQAGPDRPTPVAVPARIDEPRRVHRNESPAAESEVASRARIALVAEIAPGEAPIVVVVEPPAVVTTVVVETTIIIPGPRVVATIAVVEIASAIVVVAPVVVVAIVD